MLSTSMGNTLGSLPPGLANHMKSLEEMPVKKRIECPPECRIETGFAWPIGPAGREIAQFEHWDSQDFHQLYRLAFECAEALGIDGNRTPAHGKRSGNQRRTKNH